MAFAGSAYNDESCLSSFRQNWRGKRFSYQSFKHNRHRYSTELTNILLNYKECIVFRSQVISLPGKWLQAEGNLIQMLESYESTHGLHVLLNFLGSEPFTSTGLFSWWIKVALYLDTKSSISCSTSGCLRAKLFVSQGSTATSKRQGFGVVDGLQGVRSACSAQVTVDSALSSSISSSSGMAEGRRLAIASPATLCATAVRL